MKIAFSIVILCLFTLSVRSQIFSLRSQNENICQGNSLIVAVKAESFNSIGAISMAISSDTSVMDFESIQNIHPMFTNMKVNDYRLNGKNLLEISWYNIYGVSIDTFDLFELEFSYKSGNAFIGFEAGCEITNSSLQLINTSFVNLEILPSITIQEEPKNSSVYFPEETGFSVIVEGATDFQWQGSMDDGSSFFDLQNNQYYYGVNTSILQISRTNPAMDQMKFRCRLSGNECTTYTSAALLNLVFPPTDEFEIVFNEGWNSFSSFLNAGYPEPDSVFSAIMNKLIYLGDEQGNFFSPNHNPNTLDNFESKKGYLIKLSGQSAFSFEGYEMTNKTISLDEGWNLMPVLSNCNLSISDLNPIFLENVIIIKEAIGTNVYWPEKNILTQQVLEPGKAYWVKLNSGMVLDFSDCDR